MNCMPRANSSHSNFRPKIETAAPEISWIEPRQAALMAESGTDCHRLCTSSEGWIERLGADAVVSFKRPEAGQRLQVALAEWSAEHPGAIRRTFSKFIPRQNEDRS